MGQQTVHSRSNRDQAEQLVRLIPQALARGAAGRTVLLKAGDALLGLIREAFIAKSKGGTDAAGDRWAPLKPGTIAGRATRGKREQARESRPSQGLTKKQQERWWDLYRQGLAIHHGNKGRAAARAWTIIKGEGAVTLLQKYGQRKVDILNRSGQLLASLSPGSNSPHQIVRIESGAISVGTSRPGAMAHHYGVRKRGLPQRRLWPDPKDWPSDWWRVILDVIKAGTAELVVQRAKGK